VPFTPGGDLVEARAELRRHVDTALRRLAKGQLPTDVEREHIDLKEEAGRRGRGGVLLAGEPRNLAAADQLADEVSCLANTPGGGALIVGVEDASGQLLGAGLDVEWLRHRIYERVDVAPAVEERVVAGVRLLAIYVAEAREPLEDTRGRTRWRTGRHCVPVDRAEWWLHRREAAGHDPLGGPSRWMAADVDAGARALVRRLAEPGVDGAGDVDGVRAPSDAELLTRIGALRPDGYVTQAAAVLLCADATTQVSVAVLDVEGGDVLAAPPQLGGLSLLEQLTTVEQRLDAVNSAVPVRTGLTEQPVRLVPPAAIREALCNALVHRDWLQPEPVEVTWVQADAALTVLSPGGFTGGVDESNALTSRWARSPALADLFRALRLVEKQGLGVDRMVRDLVSLGHRPPSLRQVPGPRVRVRLVGGQPVLPVLSLVGRMQPAVRRRDVRVALIIHTLLNEPFVTADGLVPVLQRPQDETVEALLAAAECRVDGEPLLTPYKDVWVLSSSALRVVEGGNLPRALRGVSPLLPYRRPASAHRVAATWLRDHDRLSSGDTALLTGLTQAGSLRQLERLERDAQLSRGEGMGRNAHFVPGPNMVSAPQPPPLFVGGPL